MSVCELFWVGGTLFWLGGDEWGWLYYSIMPMITVDNVVILETLKILNVLEGISEVK